MFFILYMGRLRLALFKVSRLVRVESGFGLGFY